MYSCAPRFRHFVVISCGLFLGLASHEVFARNYSNSEITQIAKSWQKNIERGTKTNLDLYIETAKIDPSLLQKILKFYNSSNFDTNQSKLGDIDAKWFGPMAEFYLTGGKEKVAEFKKLFPKEWKKYTSALDLRAKAVIHEIWEGNLSPVQLFTKNKTNPKDLAVLKSYFKIYKSKNFTSRNNGDPVRDKAWFDELFKFYKTAPAKDVTDFYLLFPEEWAHFRSSLKSRNKILTEKDNQLLQCRIKSNIQSDQIESLGQWINDFSMATGAHEGSTKLGKTLGSWAKKFAVFSSSIHRCVEYAFKSLYQVFGAKIINEVHAPNANQGVHAFRKPPLKQHFKEIKVTPEDYRSGKVPEGTIFFWSYQPNGHMEIYSHDKTAKSKYCPSGVRGYSDFATAPCPPFERGDGTPPSGVFAPVAGP